MKEPHETTTIMHVIDSGGLYGAERVLIDLALECRDRGYRIIVAPIVAPEDEGDPLGDLAQSAGLVVRRFTIRDGLRLREFGAVADAARGEGVHVIHSHGYKPNILLALLGRRRKPCPTLATLHGWTARRAMSRMRVYEALERSLLGRLDHVVAVSPTIRDRVPVLAGRGKVSVIPNGIAGMADASQPADTRVLAFVGGHPSVLAAGRLSPEKGFDTLIRATRRLKTAFPAIRVVIAGEGPARPRLESLIREEGLRDNILLPGYVSNVRCLMGSFRTYALSSYTEGSPIVILEAMAERLPIVATHVGAIPQILDGGGCGRLVPPGDAEAISDALGALLHDDHQAGRLAEAANARFARLYSSRAMADAYHARYMALAERTRGPKEGRPI